MAYEEEIANLAAKKKNKRFYNSDSEHAKIVVRELMANADSYVYIVCCDMCADVSNNDSYIEAVKNFLTKDSKPKIEILFTHYKNYFMDLPIAQTLKQYPEQVLLKRLPEGMLIGKDGNQIDFTVSDDRAYRVEIDVDNQIAFGNFNNCENAKVLKERFEHFFSDPEMIAIPLQ